MGLESALGLWGYARQIKGFIYAAQQPLALIAVDWEVNEVTECIMQCSANSWGKWKKDGKKLHPQTRDSSVTS